MSQTYHTSYSGMLAASFGLQNAANNIANMQTPGFKRNDVFYNCLGSGARNQGAGVTVGGSAVNFNAGKYLPGNSPTDLAINGQGFFIIKMHNGELLYTRNGEFYFNEKGILTDRQSQGEVQGFDGYGNLTCIQEKGPEISPGKASQTLWLSGQFVPVKKSETEQASDMNPLKNNFNNIEFTVDNVFDSEGNPHKLTLTFESTRNQPNIDGKVYDDGSSWTLLRIACDDADVKMVFNHPLVFSTGRFLRPDESTIHCMLNDQPVSLEFGNFHASEEKAVQLQFPDTPDILKNSSIKVFQQDGYAKGKQIRSSFDEQGEISWLYDNGQTIKGHSIAVSVFQNMEHTLEKNSGNLFRAKTLTGRYTGRPGNMGAGTIQTGTLENANVDSATEFANIVVLQRMFQSCSQIMNIDKELLEGLYKR